MANEEDAEAWTGQGVDWTAFVLAFKGVLLEGLEVAFIVVSFGANANQLNAAVIGRASAVVVVGAVGAVLRPLVVRTPRSLLQLAVGILLTTFSSFLGTRGPRRELACSGRCDPRPPLCICADRPLQHRDRAPPCVGRRSGELMIGRLVSWLAGCGRFWYRFIIGDDWTVAAAVAAGLIVTAALNARGVAAWWLIPLIVIVLVRVSVQRSRRV